MIKTLKNSIANTLINLPGWRTSRKIIVIDSDDWGSIRMPDASTYRKLLAEGVRVDNCPYNKYDSLASEKDLTDLFEVLNSFRDINGRPPVITANIVPANPDFEKIKESGFNEYHYELFPETLKRYPNHAKSFHLWQEGLRSSLFYPQFHGREHLNVARWMSALKDNLPETRLAFDYRLFGISTIISQEKRRSYLAAFDAFGKTDVRQIKGIITDGLLLFEKMFGYSSKSFIAPNYIWPSLVEQHLSEHNVRYIKGLSVQFSPVSEAGKTKKIRHFTGHMNLQNQIHIVRNCRFEPSLDKSVDSTNECLAQIEYAFRLKKPAVITSHRVNYIGSVDPLNRERNLPQLRNLITRIQQKWPDTEFMTADQLGDLIHQERVKAL